jgi:myo-inositol-1(or 4)-monophosphatase
MSTSADLAAFACALADAARAVTLPAAAEAQLPENKATDGRFDPVTAADRGAEQAMRALIEADYPEHGIDGEEFGSRPALGRLRWSLDPIDGTRAFICSLPSWTTLIALLEDDAPILGVIDAPAIGERYLGAEGKTELVTAAGARTLATSGCDRLSEARLATTDPYLFARAEADAFARLRGAVRLTRYGWDAYAYARLAAGGIDLVVESGLQSYDLNALVPIVRGAGGIVGNWRGGNDLGGGDLVAAASQPLFDAAIALLAKPAREAP